MKLEEAIEILTINALEHGTYLPLAYVDALKLGIEALKRAQKCRTNEKFSCYDLLPGETKD